MKKKILSLTMVASLVLSSISMPSYALETDRGSDDLPVMTMQKMDSASYADKILQDEAQCSNRFIVKYKTDSVDIKENLQAESKKVSRQLLKEKEARRAEWEEHLNEDDKVMVAASLDNGAAQTFSVRDVETAPILEEKSNLEVIMLPESVDSSAFVAQVQAKMGDEIEYIQPDIKMELASVDTSEIVPAVLDKDENLSLAQSKATGEGVIVALIDTAVDASHPDLVGKFVQGSNANINQEPLTGMAAIQATHGTHIAGIITQVAPGVKIMPFSTAGPNQTYVYTSDIISAIDYAESYGADIVNCSWSCSIENPALEEAMRNSELFFVVAAGNSRKNLDEHPIYPAGYQMDNMITVGSINADGGMSYFSNYGDKVDIAAWGREVQSTFPNGEYGEMSGTSVSAGFVTGAAALAVSNGTSVDQLKTTLKASAVKTSSLIGKVDDGNALDFSNLVYGVNPQDTLTISYADDFDKWTSKGPEGDLNIFNSLKTVQVEADISSTAVLKEDGSVWMWGYNYSGDSDDDWYGAPHRVIGLQNVKEISLGMGHLLALRQDGSVWGCGSNDSGEVGNGLLNKSSLPVKTIGLSDVKTVKASGSSSFAVKNDGSVWRWGYNLNTRMGLPEGIDEPQNYVRPVPVTGLSNIIDIDASVSHIIALKSDGTVWGWAENNVGQLGDGTNINKVTPVQCLNLTGIKSIAAADGYSVALKENGTVWAWGSTPFGKAENGGMGISSKVPVQINDIAGVADLSAGSGGLAMVLEDGNVWLWASPYSTYLESGLVSGISEIVDVSIGNNHIIALDKNSEVWTWGDNATGKLGYEMDAHCSLPTKMVKISDVKSVGTGIFNSYMLTNKGDMYGCGLNYTGQLGEGNPKGYSIPIKIEGLPKITQFSADIGATVMAVDENGDVWGWGSNEPNLLLNGMGSVRTPVKIEGISDVKKICLGDSHVLALKEDGTVWSWGRNNFGELGTGTDADCFVPTQVVNLTDVKDIVAGGYYSIALKNDGSVWAWGYRLYGYLGNGYDENERTHGSNVPVAVSIPADVKDISGKDGIIVAVREDGTVWTWGHKIEWLLGTINWYTSQYNYVPVQITGLSDIKEVEAGRNRIFLTKNDGTIWAWGENSSGELGDGTFRNSIKPVQVKNLTNVKEISSDGMFTVALKEDGTVWAWGDDSLGALGIGRTLYSYVPQKADFQSKTILEFVPTLEKQVLTNKDGVNKLDLPEQTEATLSNGEAQMLNVVWDTSGYDPNKVGTYMLYGNVQLPAGVSNPHRIRLEKQVDVVPELLPSIVSIDKQQIAAEQGLPLGIGDKAHAIGGVASIVDVPQTVTVHFETGDPIELSVIWNESMYDPYKTGKQVITGTVNFNVGVSNPNSIEAELEITTTPATYEVLSIAPENISVNVAKCETLAEVYKQLLPKTIDIEAMNSETGDIVYIYSDYTLSDEYVENSSFDPSQPGEQPLIGRFDEAILDTFMPPYVEITANVTESTIASVETAEMTAYQMVAFENNENIPQQVMVTLEDGTKIPVDVAWNTENYYKEYPGDQMITGRLINLPAGAMQPEEEKVAAMIIHVEPVDYTMTAIMSTMAIDDEDMPTVDAGLTLDEVNAKLAAEKKNIVTVKLESVPGNFYITTEYEMSFNFLAEENPEYDPNEATLYVMNCHFLLPYNVTKLDGLTHEVFLMTNPVEIESIEPTYVTVTMGTEFADVEKPSQVQVNLSNGKQVMADVDWGTGEGYLADSDTLTEDNPIVNTITSQLSGLPAYVNYYNEEASLVITVILPNIYYINSISPARIPESGTTKVNLGSSLEDIYAGLGTHSVTVELRNLKNVISTQEVTFTLREEDNAGYDPMQQQEFELVGYLNLPDNIENPDNLQVTLSVKPTKYTIKSVVAVKKPGVIAGTPFAEIGLPEKASVNYTDTSTGELPVTWNGSTYKPDKIGAQAVKGTFVEPLPAHVENPNNRQPVAAVTVVNPTVKIISAVALDNMPMMYAIEADEENEKIPGIIERKFMVELLHEDGSITEDIISVFDFIEEE